ncbi:hypothetical protein MA16_Dca007199 [Dendrobium catenatum]|uniref:Uncharacterized protein n=1 Tax=Dendrobium catenatum TaxID=906689 RepID=A0A2I0W6B8_9ASPA|nr:hypothetical protein MA16_Dca007199 [Dendrobium catenatum]
MWVYRGEGLLVYIFNKSHAIICWTIQNIIFLTWLFLKTKYIINKFAGVAICIVGLVLVVLYDVHAIDRIDRVGGYKVVG